MAVCHNFDWKLIINRFSGRKSRPKCRPNSPNFNLFSSGNRRCWERRLL